MQPLSLRPSEEFERKYEKYGRMLFKIAMIHLGNRNDAEEAVQEAFLKLYHKAPPFRDEEHEKAWLIRVAVNHCKNLLGSAWFRRVLKRNDIERVGSAVEDSRLMDMVLKLPVKYKAAIHLFYYEDYSVKRIADTLNISESAVKMRLRRGRELLKFEWEEEAR